MTRSIIWSVGRPESSVALLHGSNAYYIVGAIVYTIVMGSPHTGNPQYDSINAMQYIVIQRPHVSL